MTGQNQSCLRFSLEESIWFPKGQEVSELYSLSIEPNVVISERNQYIVIEGTLEVSGEYRGVEESGDWEYTESTSITHTRYVQNVERNEEDDINTFYHTFPVDISIPANRIENRNLIEVDISTFDYNMPENSCIKLVAELLISGIYDESEQYGNQTESQLNYSMREDELQQNEEYTTIDVFMPQFNEQNHHVDQLERDQEETSIKKESSIYESLIRPAEESMIKKESSIYESLIRPAKESMIKKESSIYESFTAEAYARPEEDSKVKRESSVYESFMAESHARPVEDSTKKEEVPFQMSHYQPIGSRPFQTEFSIPIPTFMPVDVQTNEALPNREEIKEEKVESKVLESSINESLQVVRNNESKIKVEESVEEVKIYQPANNREEALDVNEKQESKKEQEKVVEHNRSTVSLTDFFAKKDTNTQTKLKVCIVQNGESITDLANRYHVSKHEIVSSNGLNSENDITEGQVLYIPRVTVQK